MEIPWGNGRARLSLAGEDIFRLRLCCEKFARDCSWAIPNAVPDLPFAPLETSAFSARSSSASLAADSVTREWALFDAKSRPLLQGSEIGFHESQGVVRIALQERDRIFGLGETTGLMDKRGLRRELWNIDVLGHAPGIHPSLRSLYVSIPFAILWRDGRPLGIFWDNPARQTWDMGCARPDELRIECASGEINLYIFAAPTIAKIVEGFTALTGRTPLPPRWALGYHQCRYSYERAERVLEIAANFRQRQIPCDAIYLDIDHMDGYRVFTFGATFAKPKDLTAKLAEQGFRTVAIVDPGVKDDPKFGVLRRGVKLKAFVKSPDGADYIGQVWPGPSRYPDFLRASVRSWWAREQQALHKVGIAGIWNDMNEPSNFAHPSRTLPEDCLHRTDFGPAPHREVHNVYGSAMASASREGAVRFDPQARPFAITRAGYAGLQRHALVWTGDNSSSWEHLADVIPSLLNLSLSGVPFCGSDIGGFLENATGELLARWTQLAAFTPFFRNHSNTGTRAQEPWAFGQEIESVCRAAIQWRYQLLPYIYSLFERANRDGTPIIRPLVWHHQNDAQSAATQDEFLLGKCLLVAPIIQPGARSRGVYLPPGTWHDFWTGESHRGGESVLAQGPLSMVPLYIRAGGIIPFAPCVQHTGEYSSHEITLQIWPGADGSFDFYEDDGQTIGSEVYRRRIEFLNYEDGGVVRFGPAGGKYKNGPKRWRVIVHRMRPRAQAFQDGAELEILRDREHGFLSFEVVEHRRPFDIIIA